MLRKWLKNYLFNRKYTLNIVEKSLFCTSQGSVVRVCRWGGHICIFLFFFVKFLQDVVYQKLLKSVDILQSYSKNKKIDQVFLRHSSIVMIVLSISVFVIADWTASYDVNSVLVTQIVKLPCHHLDKWVSTVLLWMLL